ncbi:hypothetical protein [Hyella patelloides]|uniref:hypothetical protein n=1 Tax=Hyella patelloides TaxID=1982969 RepID=UPI001643F9F2|nr:hypothetical protein [Hyella patelloides]
MSIFVIIFLLLFGNWLLSDLLVFFPLSLIERISSLSWLVMAISALLFLSWCLGDD